MSILATPNFRRFVRQLHWISASLVFMSLIFYAVTGFVLNNEDDLLPKPQATQVEKPLTEAMLGEIATLKSNAPLPESLRASLSTLTGADLRYAMIRVDKGTTTITMPAPGVKASLKFDMDAKTVTYDRSTRGPLGVLTDLHKDKGAGSLWHLYINIFAIAVVIFALSGFVLLLYAANNRAITWPLIIGGLALPLIILLALLHV